MCPGNGFEDAIIGYLMLSDSPLIAKSCLVANVQVFAFALIKETPSLSVDSSAIISTYIQAQPTVSPHGMKTIQITPIQKDQALHCIKMKLTTAQRYGARELDSIYA